MKELRILVADDTESMTRLIEKVLSAKLKHLKFVLSTFNNPVNAIQEIEKESPFNLVVTDMQMPRNQEGFAVIKAARAKSPDTKIILMSETATETEITESGADMFLQKPFTADDLIGKIEKLIPETAAAPK